MKDTKRALKWWWLQKRLRDAEATVHGYRSEEKDRRGAPLGQFTAASFKVFDEDFGKNRSPYTEGQK